MKQKAVFVLLLLLICSLLLSACDDIITIEGYTGVLEDLGKALNFDVSEYVKKLGDYSLQVIQIGESDHGELFLYVYQPSGKVQATKTGYVLSTSSGSNTMYYPITIAPTATLNNYTLTVTLNEGVQSVTVTYGTATKTFTSSGTMSVPAGTGVTWTATAATGYNLASSSGAFNMSAAHTIAPTATIKTNILHVTLNEGVQSVTVTYGTATKTFTSDGVLSISYGTNVTWTATAKAEYIMSTGSGSITSMTSAQTIAPTATHNPYTLTVTLKTGVASVTVKYGSTSKTFTSSGTVSVPYGTGVTWTAVAATGYNLESSSGSLNMSSDKTIAPTATIKTNILHVTLNEGVQSVTVTYGTATKTFTSDGVLSISYGTNVTWTATAKAGYTMSTGSGSITSMTSAQTIAPTATVKTFTVAMSYNPSDANYTTFSWKLEWVSGKSLTGDVSDYVTMTVASDGKSVTLTFKQNFSAGEMVLTCYATADPTIKGTCTVKCGS